MAATARIPLLNLTGQYRRLENDLHAAVAEVLASGAYIQGPAVEKFEHRIAAFLEVKHAVGVASGTDALLLSLHALGIGPGDAVVIPAFGFVAAAEAVCRLGAEPIFVDVEEGSYNLDLDQLQQILRDLSGIRAIIPVHLFGRPCPMEEIMKLAEPQGVYVVEDACQAINSEFYLQGTWRKAGTAGNTGCFSFFPSKNLGGYGDGGLVVSQDDELVDTIRALRVHGCKNKYHHHRVGYNSRLDALQAALLHVKLGYLQEWTQKRRAIARLYNEELERRGLTAQVKPPEVVAGHVFNQYVVQVEKRDELADFLTCSGIQTAVYYPLGLHQQACFAGLGYPTGSLPVTERLVNHCLALPIDPELTEADVCRVVEAIDRFYSGAQRE